MDQQSDPVANIAALSAEDREYLAQCIAEGRRTVQIPDYLPPTEEDLARQRALFEETLQLREKTKLPGTSVDDLLRELREDDLA